MTKFVIRERNTGTYCSSSNRKIFGEIDDAVLFLSKENAEKVVRGMFPKIHEHEDAWRYVWTVPGQNFFNATAEDRDKFVEFFRSRGGALDDLAVRLQNMTILFCDFEIVEVRIAHA